MHVPSEVNLTSLVMDEERRVILVTAPSPSSGTTRCVAHLALQLAGHVPGRVLIIDTSASPNNISRTDGSGRVDGLTRLLSDHTGEVDVSPFVVKIDTPRGNLDLLPIGDRGADAYPFQAKEIKRLLEDLRKHYRFVIIDSDSVYEGASTLTLSAVADATVLVLAAESTRWEVAQAAVQRLTQAGARLIGTVFNRRKYYMPRWVYEKL